LIENRSAAEAGHLDEVVPEIALRAQSLEESMMNRQDVEKRDMISRMTVKVTEEPPPSSSHHGGDDDDKEVKRHLPGGGEEEDLPAKSTSTEKDSRSRSRGGSMDEDEEKKARAKARKEKKKQKLYAQHMEAKKRAEMQASQLKKKQERSSLDFISDMADGFTETVDSVIFPISNFNPHNTLTFYHLLFVPMFSP
jgi:hypothetical protein